MQAYNCPNGCARLNFFSNPNKFYGGQPTGVAQTAANSADNAYTINYNAPTINNFRVACSGSLKRCAGSTACVACCSDTECSSGQACTSGTCTSTGPGEAG